MTVTFLTVASCLLHACLNRLITVRISNETAIEAPKPLKKNLKKLKRFQRSLSRCQKGSKRREKARLKVAKVRGASHICKKTFFAIPHSPFPIPKKRLIFGNIKIEMHPKFMPKLKILEKIFFRSYQPD